MKTSLLFVVTLLIAVSVQGQKRIKGNGKVQTITRTTSDYDGIKCAGSFDYVLVYGIEGKITIEGEENLLEYIVTEVKDGNLIIKIENRINLSTTNNKTIKITIPFKDIQSVSLAGSGELRSIDKIYATNFNASLAGSGDIFLMVDATVIKASLSGSGELTLKGNTNSLDADIAGSGNFHGFDLQSENTEVSVAGSGDADIVCNGNLKARVSGSGDITYKGNPKTEDTKVAGSGKIESK